MIIGRPRHYIMSTYGTERPLAAKQMTTGLDLSRSTGSCKHVLRVRNILGGRCLLYDSTLSVIHSILKPAVEGNSLILLQYSYSEYIRKDHNF